MNKPAIFGLVFVLVILVWLPTWHILGTPRIAAILATAAIGGPMSILASLFNWHWFFNDKAARPTVEKFGRSWARFIYAFLGMIALIPGSIGLALSGVFYYSHLRSWIASVMN